MRPKDDDLDGEDILLHAGEMFEAKNGDVSVVSGVQLARQTVVREVPANPGSLPRRQDWGAGVSGMLMKGVTSATRDKIASRIKARLLANRLIIKIQEISVTSRTDGVLIVIRADSLGGQIFEQFVVRSPGV